jgi:hypothetical protein
MRKKDKDQRSTLLTLGEFWSKNTHLAIMFIAFITFLFMMTPWFGSVKSSYYNYLIPVFVTFIVLELIFFRAHIESELKHIRENVENEFSWEAFVSGELFDDYLAYRFQRANDVKIIHISSSVSDENSERRYHEILDKYIKSGKILQRIFSDTTNKNVFKWILQDLKDYEKNKHFIYFLEEIKVGKILQADEVRTQGIMIIDDNEVCLGGGYITSSKIPTISVRNKTFARFYLDYFNYLQSISIPIRSNHRNNAGYIENLLKIV